MTIVIYDTSCYLTLNQTKDIKMRVTLLLMIFLTLILSGMFQIVKDSQNFKKGLVTHLTK